MKLFTITSPIMGLIPSPTCAGLWFTRLVPDGKWTAKVIEERKEGLWMDTNQEDPEHAGMSAKREWFGPIHEPYVHPIQMMETHRP